jgi:hypothetical protein
LILLEGQLACGVQRRLNLARREVGEHIEGTDHAGDPCRATWV